MARRYLLLLVCALASLQGCVRGVLYQDITVPYFLDMKETPIGPLAGEASAYRLQEPFSGANITVEWDSYGLGDAVKNGAVSKVFIADLRQQSAAFGIWRRDTLVINGKEFAVPAGSSLGLSADSIRKLNVP